MQSADWQLSENIDPAVQSAISSTSVDGHSVTQDLALLQQRQRDYRLRDRNHIIAGYVRPVKVRLLLGGSW